jgi:hypothetical protein
VWITDFLPGEAGLGEALEAATRDLANTLAGRTAV